ncbi:hypothetical protein [Phytoactinopolyspora limicola]|uniref:hypothetical protein n=1 Tax=Phytoactinopolyspora limicola TaxID=2715536 RepID=UPI0014088B3E|nr:hypothetical protein [Phytoactinopolyspora limicola]
MRRMIRTGAALGLTAAVSLSLLVGAGAELPGGGGDSDGDGYTVAVSVDLSGDGAPGGGGSYTVHVPPVCWWVPLDLAAMGWADIDPSDPGAIKEYVTENILPGYTGHAASGRHAWPDVDVFDEAIERYENGDSITWYQIASESPDAKPCSPHVHDVSDDLGNEIPVRYTFFVTGSQPEPVIDPEDLAEAARDVMVIDEPEVDRNPKMAGSSAGATLVNIATWFWVTNPDSVGGPDGERTIRADVAGGDVWAEVTARTGGLSIASPSGSVFCEPSLALIEWGDADEGCTVTFRRASIGYANGYPVTASTEWSATWEGQTQDGDAVGGELDPLSRDSEVFVPVAEIQSIVRGLL